MVYNNVSKSMEHTDAVVLFNSLGIRERNICQLNEHVFKMSL